MEEHNNKYCPNCGAEVHGRYCHECGQDQKHYRVSVRHILNDFTSDYLTIDSKLFRSIIPLLFKPGYLTNQYLNGKRVSFIRPLRMYLFASFVFFFVLSISSNKLININGSTQQMSPADSAIVDSSLQRLDKQLGGILDSTEIQQLKSRFSKDVAPQASDSAKTDSSGLLRSVNMRQNSHTKDLTFRFKFRGKPYKYTINQKTFRRDFINNLPTMMFFLLPIFALYLKLLYIRRNRLYVEHLVFSLYTHAFIFLVETVIILLPWSLPATILGWSILLYLYVAMKRVYAQGYLKTFIKFSGLLFFYALTLGISLVVTILATVVLS